MKRRLLLAAGTALALPRLGLAQAQAQTFPSRPVRLVVPFAPAGIADILGRQIAEPLAALWGQPLVIDNRAGASGHIGAAEVARAPGDGHTLMVGTIGIHAAHASYTKLSYKPAEELRPITVLAEAANVVVVPAASPYRSFAELLADAKANPGKLRYGSAGPGSSVHMVTALFELASGARLAHIPYKGSGPALVDLIGGQIDVMFENIGSGMTHIRSGKLRALAVTGPVREPTLPDLPTLAEAGVAGYAATSWWTVAAPRSLPDALAQRIAQDLRRVLATPEQRARFEASGVRAVLNSPAEAAAFFASETQKWSRVIAAAKLQLD
ncbi:MAG: tripartite tricarboxylate transporter substrate binding protein [Burkholderiaceae bacterium]|nr:tripartite tricarboxylate transporter substrate binding protein [Burkholderiaceae bacterium]